LGKAATISGYVSAEWRDISGDYEIDIDGFDPPLNKKTWSCDHDAVEPILNEYDGNEVKTWDESPWQPEGVKV